VRVVFESLPNKRYRVVELHDTLIPAIGTVFGDRELQAAMGDSTYIITIGLLHRSHIESEELEREMMDEKRKK